MKIHYFPAIFTMISATLTTAVAEPEILEFRNDGTPIVVRNYIAQDVANKLYQDLRDVGFPIDGDQAVHPSLVESKGHAGNDLENQPAPHESLDQVYQPNSKQSTVLRLEHMDEYVYDLSQNLVNQVVPNDVMGEGGTIHLYVSSPGAAALDNHTDTTDIFVLHLDGAKEWLFCEEHEEDLNDPFIHTLTHKLESCSTYKKKEIDTLKCWRTVLYPGDALHLPRRVVHSAQAVSSVPSAHLTFGFAREGEDHMCQNESYADEFIFDPQPQRRLGCKKCNDACDGSCDKSCDWKGFWTCDKGCDNDCDQNCNANVERSSCNSGCDGLSGGCDEGCDEGCP